MRVPNDELVLTEYTGEDLPPYAILTHTWGQEEVSFQDIGAGTGKIKAGWKKIDFCMRQAEADGLRYIWVDTCCTIQTHHRRQRPTKRVTYAAENGGRTYIAF